MIDQQREMDPVEECKQLEEEVLTMQAAIDPADLEKVAPLWIKWFGGAILSIIALLLLTLFGYVISTQNGFSKDLLNLNGDVIKKSDLKASLDPINEQLKEFGGLKERFTGLEQQIKQLTEECKELRADLQIVREKVIKLEVHDSK